MGYNASEYVELGSNQSTSESVTWTTVCETPPLNIAIGDKIRVKAGWRATATVLAGSMRLVLHDGSTDAPIGTAAVAPLGECEHSIMKQTIAAVAPAAFHVAKLQFKAGSLGTVSVAAGNAWIEIYDLTS